jgi:hypothetical protein
MAILKEFAVNKLKGSNFTYDFTILAVCCMYVPSQDDKIWYEKMI